MAHAKKEMLSFFMTTTCNLACKYCYVPRSDFKRQAIDLEFAKLGIDDFFEHNDSRLIRFFGAGEPTNEFNLMKKIRDHAFERAGADLKVEIQTNGCFSEEVCEWLSKNADIIWLSWDGQPEVQDFYRPYLDGRPTSKVIEKNAKYLIENGKGMTGARATVGSLNLSKQDKMIEYFADLGIRHIWSDPIFKGVGEGTLDDKVDLMEYAKEFLEAKKIANDLGIFYGSLFTCNFDEETEYNCRACLPMPHLTTDGHVSACDMALFGEDRGPMQAFIYGKWDKQNHKIVYDNDKIKRLRSRSADNMSGCKDCGVLNHCAGYCLGEVLNETGDLFGKKKAACDAIQFLSENLLLNVGRYEYIHP